LIISDIFSNGHFGINLLTALEKESEETPENKLI